MEHSNHSGFSREVLLLVLDFSLKFANNLSLRFYRRHLGFGAFGQSTSSSSMSIAVTAKVIAKMKEKIER